MYRYPTTTLKKDPVMCTSPDCENKSGSHDTDYIKAFRIDFVKTSKKEVTIGNDLYLQQVCTDCFLRIIRIEIERLGKKEQLH